MALSRLLLVTCAMMVVLCSSVLAQIPPTTANQDGIFLMDSLGRFYTATMNDNSIGAFLFQELENSSQSIGFPFPIAKDLELVAQPDGKPRGAYVLDGFGGQHPLSLVGFPVKSVSSPIELGSYDPRFSIPPYFGFDVAEDLEIAPDWRDTTNAFRGYFVLDADGVVHPVGDTNLPQYAFFANATTTNINDATLFATLFPETLDISGSSLTTAALLQGGPLTIPVNRPYTANQLVSSATPIFTYFGLGSDIARDLEVSSEFVTVTIPSQTTPGAVDTRTIAMTNGYYVMDGFGAVHSSRLPLDFDTDNDGRVLYTDLYSDFADGEFNPDFGTPINNAVLAAPWVTDRIEDRANLPYFGADVAVDVEITPSGRGFYLLDAYGGVFAVGDAQFPFQPQVDDNGNLIPGNRVTPYFGFPIARDIALVPNAANPSLGLQPNRVTMGLLVLDGFGTMHQAGLAGTYDISETGDSGFPITAFSDTFRSVEVTPAWSPTAPQPQYFSVGSTNVPISTAPGYRTVTASFTSISTPQ